MEPEQKIQILSSRLIAVAKEFEACKDAFSAMGDETRQIIVIALLQNWGECVWEN